MRSFPARQRALFYWALLFTGISIIYYMDFSLHNITSIDYTQYKSSFNKKIWNYWASPEKEESTAMMDTGTSLVAVAKELKEKPLPVTPNVTWLLVLSYQRSGSSFISRAFHDPPRIFYVYEPLDPLYVAMYGIDVGWAVPDNIFTYANGSQRIVPKYEMDAVQWTLRKIFNCEMSSFPPAMLIHRFWSVFETEMPASRAYVKCLKARGIDPMKTLKKCQEHIRHKCGSVFGAKLDTHYECKYRLWGSALKPDDYSPNSVLYRRKVDPDVPDSFRAYYRCLSEVDPGAQECARDHLDAPCRASSLRVIKSVRANMAEMESLLANFNHFKLLHLIRDPRGVLFSRNHMAWSRGLYSQADLAREATIFCDQVMRDDRRRVEYETIYPDRVRRILYDDFIANPVRLVRQMHAFADASEPPSSVLKRYSDGAADLARATRWKKLFTITKKNIVITSCRTLFKRFKEFRIKT